MGRKKKADLIDTTPDKVLRRSDAIQYWLNQMDFPNPGTDNYMRLRVIDKIVINMIMEAMGGTTSAANWLFENGWGKNTEGSDVSHGGDVIAARFNTGMTVSEYEKSKADKARVAGSTEGAITTEEQEEIQSEDKAQE